MGKRILSRSYDPKEIQRNFSRVGAFYDLFARFGESKAHKVELMLADMHDGEHLLEVALGTGLLFKQLASKNPHGLNVGIDLSISMLDQAAQRMEKSGLPAHCFRLDTGNACQLPYESNSFDILVNNYMLDLLPEEDFIPILKGFKRVLKPEGRLIMASMALGEHWYNQFWYWLSKHFPELLTNCRPIEISRHLVSAGFKITHQIPVSQHTFPSEVIKAIPI